MIDDDELDRRIKAARMLRNISQADFAEALAGEGFGKHDIGRIERGDKTLQGALRRELSRLLRVPEAWFTADTVDDLIAWPEAGGLTATELSQLVEAVGPQLLAAAQALRRGRASGPGGPDGPDHPEAGLGGGDG